MSTRNRYQEYSDKLLLLFVLNEALEHFNVKKTRMQKMVFCSQWDLWKMSLEGFDYNFFRYKWGPFSTEMMNDVDHLLNLGYMEESKWKGYLIKNTAKELLDAFNSIFKRNSKSVRIINKNVRNIMRDGAYLNRIYQLPNPLNEELTIKDTAMHKNLLVRNLRNQIAHTRIITGSQAKGSFMIKDHEMEDLDLIFDPIARKFMDEGDEAVRKGELTAWTPMGRG